MFQSLFQYSNNGIVILTPINNGEDFIIKDINPEAERIEHIKKAEVLGKKITEVFPSIGNFSLLTTMRNVYRTGVAENHPTSFYQDDRIQGWRENFVYKAKTGEIINVYKDRTEEKQMEEKNLAIIKALPDLFFKFNKDGVYLDSWTSNPKLLYQVSGGLRGKRIDEVLPKIIADEAHDLIKQVVVSKEARILEYWLDLEDGRRYFESRLVYDTNQTVLAIVRDMTDKMMMLSSIEQSELKYNTLFKVNPDTILLTSVPDGRIMDINEAGELLTGYTRGELIGKTTVEMGFWVNMEDRKKYLHRMNKNRILTNFNTRIATKQEVIDALITAEVVEIGGEKYHLNIVRNISDIRKINKQLKYNEQKFRDIVENISEIVVEMDSNYKITFANSGFYKFSGYTFDDLIRMTWPEFFNEPFRTQCKIQHQKAILEKNTDIHNCTADFITKSGKTKILHVQWKIAFMNGDGIKTYMIARDATGEELKKREDRKEFNQKLLSIETNLRNEINKENV